jgi:hypothetical protein
LEAEAFFNLSAVSKSTIAVSFDRKCGHLVVADAALQAGIPAANLEQMQKLISRGSKAARVKDMNLLVQPGRRDLH